MEAWIILKDFCRLVFTICGLEFPICSLEFLICGLEFPICCSVFSICGLGYPFCGRPIGIPLCDLEYHIFGFQFSCLWFNQTVSVDADSTKTEDDSVQKVGT